MENKMLELLKTRRSVRAYKPEQITPEELGAVVEAGTWAPTGMGKQSRRLVHGYYVFILIYDLHIGQALFYFPFLSEALHGLVGKIHLYPVALGKHLGALGPSAVELYPLFPEHLVYEAFGCCVEPL